jgi:hypothetical protein
MSLEGSRQWDSQQGAYVVIPFHGRDNFAGQPIYCLPAPYASSTGGENLTTEPEDTDIYLPQPGVTPTNGRLLRFSPHKFCPMHSKGVLLSGLNALSVFTITMNTYIETFPTVDDMGLITLARPSASLDEVALEILSRAVKDLPIAVPVGDNVIGEWFAEVVSEVGPWIAAAATALGQPAIAAAATGASMLAKQFAPSEKSKQPVPGSSYGPPPKNAVYNPYDLRVRAQKGFAPRAVNLDNKEKRLEQKARRDKEDAEWYAGTNNRRAAELTWKSTQEMDRLAQSIVDRKKARRGRGKR